MRKIIFVLSLIGLFTLWSPNVSADDEDPCHTIIITCSNGTQWGVIACNWEQLQTWYKLLCGANPG